MGSFVPVPMDPVLIKLLREGSGAPPTSAAADMGNTPRAGPEQRVLHGGELQALLLGVAQHAEGPVAERVQQMIQQVERHVQDEQAAHAGRPRRRRHTHDKEPLSSESDARRISQVESNIACSTRKYRKSRQSRYHTAWLPADSGVTSGVRRGGDRTENCTQDPDRIEVQGFYERSGGSFRELTDNTDVHDCPVYALFRSELTDEDEDPIRFECDMCLEPIRRGSGRVWGCVSKGHKNECDWYACNSCWTSG